MGPHMSSGAIHAISTGNPEACPASPRLSSQTLGLVGSIANSPMELQGVNKSNSVGRNTKKKLIPLFDKKDDGESSSRSNALCDVHTSNSRSPKIKRSKTPNDTTQTLS
ncbi:hypothetical protein LWI29_010663 [Acer saccharum]|uniref:Uncharacterized protein n=1 Tax=Acer saccharum TaxID=4024 RepID=A0AA39SUQ4_ACESA|nr:hypothetical protein LWI29_010663 [Acer saccharum]